MSIDKDINAKKTAVALSYNVDDEAPKVIASGRGYLADKILNKAKESGIPIHKDEKLAQNLSKIEIGGYIPQELYEVVAEVMVFIEDIDKLKQKIDGGLH